MAKRKDNIGGNSELRGKYWNCPDYVLNAISNAVKTYESLNKNGEITEGYKRAKGILESKKIEYAQMKRIKNWFDSFDGNHNDMEYRLNGGKTMHNWVDSTLNRETEAIKAHAPNSIGTCQNRKQNPKHKSALKRVWKPPTEPRPGPSDAQ